jgi:ABC-type branched-subunit amino acid transport system permease subunit
MTRQHPRHAGQQAAESGPTATIDRRPSWRAAGAVLVLLCVLAWVPELMQPSTTSLLTSFFLLLVMASMWNLLAGYAGLISLGQQAFFGLGSYGVLLLAVHGTEPVLAVPAAVIGCGVVGALVRLLLSRLRSAYFPVAMLVIAVDCYLIFSRYQSLGGTFGIKLPGLPKISQAGLAALVYWMSLGVTALALISIYLVLRSRVGRQLSAATEDETSAQGIRSTLRIARLLVFVIAAAGCGAAGAVGLLHSQFAQPSSVFSVQWSAEMIFAVLIGGIGTIEGPIVGAIVVFLVQRWLAPHGSWSLIFLGLVAAAVAIWEPRGIWGLVPDKFKLLPAGNSLWPARQPRQFGNAPNVARDEVQPEA